jgi:hypothetical protein
MGQGRSQAGVDARSSTRSGRRGIVHALGRAADPASAIGARAVLLALAALTLAAPVARSEPRPLPELRWRMIGPFRGGRTKGGGRGSSADDGLHLLLQSILCAR